MSRILVLGAGIVGICCALSLRRRGHDVTLIDRSPPASETSHGNAGVIAQCGIHPLADPALLSSAPRLLLNRDTRFHLEYAELPWLAGWLGRFAANMNRRAFVRHTDILASIAVDAVDRHRALMNETGTSSLLNDTGWLHLLPPGTSPAAAQSMVDDLLPRGIPCKPVSAARIRELEPDLKAVPDIGLWMTGTPSVSDPAALARGYHDYFLGLGGRFQGASARAISPVDNGWRVDTDSESLDADQVVMALGAWSNTLLAPLGIRLPFVQERGYHMMFAPAPGKRLHRSMLESRAGFVLTPMSAGIRCTTGCNLSAREREPNPVQLRRLMPVIRDTFPLGEELLETPWMGRRTSTPDSLPLIGSPEGHRGLVIATGHGHLGLTLGPVTGELVADEIDGKPNPLARPFSPARR